MFLVLLLGFLAVLHLPFFRRQALWNSMQERAAWAMALSLLVMGGLHLVRPEDFMDLLPDYLPAHRTLVYGGGAALVAGALGMVWKKVRRFSSMGVVGMLGAFLPANFQMAMNGFQLPGGDHLPANHWLGWASVPLQFLYMFWAWKVGKR